MEGSELLRRRGPQRNIRIDLISIAAEKSTGNSSAPEGEKSDNMAAGSSRIIRYVLFAFFVCRVPNILPQPLALTVLLGCNDPLLHILFINTKANP